MKRLYLAGAVATAALLAVPAAYATPSFSIQATLTENPGSGNGSSQGGPVITPGLTFTDSGIVLSLNTTKMINTQGSQNTGFFTLDPNNNCKGPSNPIGTAGCFTPTFSQKLAANDLSWNGTETDIVGGTFVITDTLGNQVTITEGGVFTAKYGGKTLPCSNSSPGNTDCFIWNGSTPTNNGVSGVFSDNVTFSDGTALTVNFINNEDWAIAAELSMVETAGPHTSVPEPASIALLGLGLLGTVATVRRRRA